MRAMAVRAWLSIREPRMITIIQTFAYAACAAGGVSTLVAPPGVAQGTFGLVVTTLWGWLALVGGLAGVISCPRGVWLVERPAVVLCMTAMVLYAGISLSLHFVSAYSYLPQFFAIMVALLYFLARLFTIRRYSYDPER